GIIDTIVVSANDPLGGDSSTRATAVAEPGRTAIIGQPALPGNSLATLVVQDSDANADVLAAETVTVTVTCAATGDTETVMLTESAVRSEWFTGGMPLSDTCAVVSDDGVLVAGLGDSVIIRYLDARHGDSAAVVAAVTPCLRPCTTAFTAAGYALLAPVQVIVIDANANHRPLVADTVTVTLTSQRGADTEMLVLTETAAASGIFAGSISTSDTCGEMSHDGIMLAGGGDTLLLQYRDADDATDSGSASAAVMRRQRPAWAALAADTLTLPGAYLLQVGDADANGDPRRADTITVIATTPAEDTEYLVLTETGDTSGLFAALCAVSETQGTQPGDGSIAGGRGMLFTLRYADAADAADSATDTAVLTAARRRSAGALARIYHVAADSLTVTIADADANLQPCRADTLWVAAWCTATGDSELVLLTETTETSGWFTTAGFDLSDTAGVAAGNGTLYARPGDSFGVRYADAGDATDTWSDYAVMQLVDADAEVWLRPAAWLAGETVTMAGALWLEVQDTDENHDPELQDSVTVTLAAGRLTDTETVALYEVGTSSGRFRSAAGVALSSAAAVPGDGVLQTFHGDTPFASYRDATAGTTAGDSITVCPNRTPAAALFTDTAYAAVALYVIDQDTPWLQLNDGDADRYAWLAETVSVMLHSECGDSETLIMTESGVSAGLFRGGGMPFDSGAAVAQDGKLQVRDGNRIWAQYQDGGDATDSTTATISVYYLSNRISGLQCEAGGTADTWWFDMLLVDSAGDSLPSLNGYAFTAQVVSGTTASGALHDTAITVANGRVR
ncbi:MAG TPA: hypothetical protein PKM88_13885, partial [bacterium]|nr:hypothetical protein [bacterium]